MMMALMTGLQWDHNLERTKVLLMIRRLVFTLVINIDEEEGLLLGSNDATDDGMYLVSTLADNVG